MALNLRHVCLAALVAVPVTALAQSDIKLGVDGLNGIDASTPFDIPTLRDRIASVDWQEARRETEGGSQTVIRATRQGKTGFTVIGDGRGRIASIEVVSPRVGNWLGPRVGDAYENLEQNGQLGRCWPGMESYSGKVLCSAVQSDRITYVFTGRWNGADGQMPPDAVLDSWRIEKSLWRPDRFAEIAPQLIHPAKVEPAFDCTKASGTVEELICDNPDFARLDQRLNALYVQRIATVSGDAAARLRAEQRGWIKGRNDCWKSSVPEACVRATYEDRIAELSSDNNDLTELEGTAWQGLRIAGDTIPGSIDINLSFGSDGQITGSSGCNRFFASYGESGRQLQIDAIGGTRRMCPEIEMVAERRFLDALGQINGWATKDGDLVLFGSGAELTFRRL